MKNFIDLIYTLLIAAGVALFVGLGIWTFYSGPKYPDYPSGLSFYGEPTEVEKKQLEADQKKFQKKLDKYDQEENAYSRNVSGIALGAGIIAFLTGMLLIKRNDLIGEGLAVGGIIIEAYASGRGVSAESRPLVFAAVTIILAMTILLALTRRDIFALSKFKRSG